MNEPMSDERLAEINEQLKEFTYTAPEAMPKYAKIAQELKTELERLRIKYGGEAGLRKAAAVVEYAKQIVAEKNDDKRFGMLMTLSTKITAYNAARGEGDDVWDYLADAATKEALEINNER